MPAVDAGQAEAVQPESVQAEAEAPGDDTLENIVEDLKRKNAGE